MLDSKDEYCVTAYKPDVTDGWYSHSRLMMSRLLKWKGQNRKRGNNVSPLTLNEHCDGGYR